MPTPSALVPASRRGLIWHAQLVRDTYHDPGVTTAPGKIKPRRPVPTVTESEFFSSLTETSDHRWIFNGVLNGWPGLRAFEVLSITCVKRAKYSLIGRTSLVRWWDAHQQPAAKPPTFPDAARVQSVRITLRAPAWSTVGYSEDSPGYCSLFCEL
jgi:hypothetical protein